MRRTRPWGRWGRPFKELQRTSKDGKDRVPPVGASAVASLCRKLPVLGTLSNWAIGIRASPTFSLEQLQVKHAESSAAAAAKVTKQQRDEYAPEQPAEAPKVGGSLAGAHAEVLVQIEVPETDEETSEVELKYSKQWLPAVVSSISDGTDTKAGSKRQKL